MCFMIPAFASVAGSLFVNILLHPHMPMGARATLLVLLMLMSVLTGIAIKS